MRLEFRALLASAVVLAVSLSPAAAAPPFEPPAENAIPKGPLGQVILQGERIFRDTAKAAPGFVGNDLTCANCHIDAGRLANASPLWAAWVAFPPIAARTGM